MHDTSEQNTANNRDDYTGFTCVNSVETDKLRSSRDLISVFQSQPQSLLFFGCNPRHKQQTSTQSLNNDLCERYNPQFNTENTPTPNQADDRFKSHCTREPVRTQTSYTDTNTGAINNVRALQTITNSNSDSNLESDSDTNKCGCGSEPCVVDKLSVQSKCWNQLRLQGIVNLDPLDPNDRMKLFGSTTNLRSQRRSELLHSVSVDETLDNRQPMSLPLPTRHSMDISSSNTCANRLLFSSKDSDEDEEKACRSNDYGFMRTRPPRSLPLDINSTSNKKSANSKLNLSTDLSQCPSNESSPMTISSGYESDSLATREADIDNIFFKTKTKKKKKVDGTADEVAQLTDYFSMSDNQGAEGLNISKENMKPELKKVASDKSGARSKTEKHAKRKEKHSKSKKQKQEREMKNENANAFTHKERQNYKLTKVARTMFEIIHDLQLDEAVAEGKKKNGKTRKSPPPLVRHDSTTTEQAGFVLPLSSATSDPHVEPQSPVTLVPVNSQVTMVDTSALSRLSPSARTPTNEHSRRDIIESFANNDTGKLKIKCVRRPLGSDPSDFNRCLPHSDSARATVPIVTENYDEQEQPMGQNVDWNKISFSKNGQVTRECNNANEIVNNNWTVGLQECTPYATTRLPGCVTPQRNKDDHVYETIPGDEFLYDELMKMRMLGLLPKLRRIPDFPGAFAHYHPPALPARNDNRPSMQQINQSFHFVSSPPLPSHPPPLRVAQQQHQQAHAPSRHIVSQQHPVSKDPQTVQNIIKQNGNFSTTPQFQCISMHQSRPSGKFRPREAFESTCQSRPLPGVPVRGRSEARDARQMGNGGAVRLRVHSQPPMRRVRMGQQPSTRPERQQLPVPSAGQPEQYLFMRDVNANVPDRASFCIASTSKSSTKMDTATYRSRSASWDGYGSLDTIRRERERERECLDPSQSVFNMSAGDIDLNASSANRRENFYFLLSNKQKRMDFSQSLELETKLMNMGCDLNQVTREFLDEDGYTTMDGFQPIGIEETNPQFLSSTYV